MTDPDEALRGLHRVPPPEFVAERDRLVARARDDGDDQLAAELKEQRKPVLAAWAVNLLAASEETRLAELVDVGAQLRSAQRDLRAEEVRKLDRERVRIQRELTNRAATLARKAGHPLGAPAVQQVEETLHAALSDPERAAQVQAGTLGKPLSYSGFGLDELSAEALLRAPKRAAEKPRSTQRKQAREASTIRAEVDSAAQEVRRVEKDLQEAQRAQEEAQRRRAELQDRIDQLDRDIEVYRSAVRKARDEHKKTQRRHRDLKARLEDKG